MISGCIYDVKLNVKFRWESDFLMEVTMDPHALTGGRRTLCSLMLIIKREGSQDIHVHVFGRDKNKKEVVVIKWMVRKKINHGSTFEVK